MLSTPLYFEAVIALCLVLKHLDQPTNQRLTPAVLRYVNSALARLQCIISSDEIVPGDEVIMTVNSLTVLSVRNPTSSLSATH